jgi:hypothetical protein
MSIARRCKLAAVLQVAWLQGCVYLPQTTEVYDRECQVVAKRLVLQGVQVAAIYNCANEGCIALVLSAGVVTAASVVISGTIVIAGNIAYWFERKANCSAA